VKRLRAQFEGGELRAMDQTSSTQTGRQHYLRLESGDQWIVPGRSLGFPKPVGMESQALDRRDMQGSICSGCKQRKPRKGGTNVNHKFLCAECKR